LYRSNSRRNEGGDGWEGSGNGRLCLSGDDDDDEDDCVTSSSDIQAVTTAGVAVGYKTTSSWQTSQSSTSSVTTTQMTPVSTTATTSTTQASHLPSLPVEQVIYQVIGTTRTPFLTKSTGASSVATDAAVQSVPDFVNPVPMNIGLIVVVAVAIAVLLCMLAYVVYKCVVAGQRPGVVGGAVDCVEKTALDVGHDLSTPQPPQQLHVVNGRPPPLLINGSQDKKDVKEWYV